MVAVERVQSSMRLRELRGPLIFAFGLAVALELIVRVVAGIGWITLVPGDIHGFDRLFRGQDAPLQERLFEPDRDLLFRMRPDFRTVYNRASLFRNEPGTFEVELNDRGFRTARFAKEKPEGIFRILCQRIAPNQND